MRAKFIVVDDQITQYEKDGKVFKNRTLSLADADDSEGPKLKQLAEMNLPAEHAPVGRGKIVTVSISEISEFSGRPRLRGELVIAPAATPAK